MDMGAIIWIITVWGCATVFTGIGVFAIKRKKPMWFWSGSTVSEDEIRDIPSYNRANAIMWICFSVPMWITGITYIWFPMVSGIVMGVSCVGGLPILIIVYQHIYKKYKN